MHPRLAETNTDMCGTQGTRAATVGETSTADKCCKMALKVYVSVTLFAAGETAWDGMFQRKQDKGFFSPFAFSSFLLLLPATFSPKQLGM